MTAVSQEVTVGLDIGTTSVKAIAADGDGNVVARARVPHRLRIPAPGRMEHDANQAWRRGPRRALAALEQPDVRAVCVAAMVPSMTAVDRRGIAARAGPALRRRAGPHRQQRQPGRERRGAGLPELAGARAPRGPRLLARAGGRQLRAVGRGGARHRLRVHDPSAVHRAEWDAARARRGRRARRAAAAHREHGGGGRQGRRRAARGRHHRRAGRAARGRRRRRRRRARHPGHHPHRLGGDARVARGAGPLDDPAHLARPHVHRRREQRGRAVPQLGHALAGRGARSGRPAPGARVAALPAGERTPYHDPDRRARAARPRPHPRRGRGAARRLRGLGLRGPPPPRPRRTRRRGASSPPAGACASPSGCRRWPTAPACRSTWSPCPRAARSAPPSSPASPPGSSRR